MDLSKMRAKLEALNRQGSTSGSKFSDNFWKPEIGKSIIRIVPSVYDKDNPFTELFFHGAKGMFQYPVLALTNLGQQDPVVDFIRQLRETSDKDNWSLSGKLTPRSRYFCPVIVRGEEEKGVRLWGISTTIYKSLLQLAADEEIGDFTDVMNGTDLVVEKVKGDPYPETTVRARRNSSPLSDDPQKVKEWLEHQPKAVDCFRHYSYDHIKKYLEAYLSGKPVTESADSGEKKTEEPEKAAPVAEPVVASKPKAPVIKSSATQKFDDLFSDDDMTGKKEQLPWEE